MRAVLLLLALAGCVPPGLAASSGRDARAAPTTYHCESGRTVEASYLSDATAAVAYRGRTYPMTIAVSASGARYVGGGLEWWTKGSGPGSEGLLFRHEADGTSGERVEFCTQAADES